VDAVVCICCASDKICVRSLLPKRFNKLGIVDMEGTVDAPEVPAIEKFIPRNSETEDAIV
jgi:hypothetical protein